MTSMAAAIQMTRPATRSSLRVLPEMFEPAGEGTVVVAVCREVAHDRDFYRSVTAECLGHAKRLAEFAYVPQGAHWWADPATRDQHLEPFMGTLSGASGVVITAHSDCRDCHGTENYPRNSSQFQRHDEWLWHSGRLTKAATFVDQRMGYGLPVSTCYLRLDDEGLVERADFHTLRHPLTGRRI